MSKKYNYIDCFYCKNWTFESRKNNLCRECNNTSKIIDPEEIFCNLCAGPMISSSSIDSKYKYPMGLYNISVSGGFESYHLLDMNKYTFSFCEKCLRELFTQCKIKPDLLDLSGHSNSISPEELWQEDQSYYEYRVWQDTGGHHQAYLNRKCNFVKDCPNDARYTLLSSSGEFSEDSSCEEHKELKPYNNSSLTKFIPNNLKSFL